MHGLFKLFRMLMRCYASFFNSSELRVVYQSVQVLEHKAGQWDWNLSVPLILDLKH